LGITCVIYLEKDENSGSSMINKMLIWLFIFLLMVFLTIGLIKSGIESETDYPVVGMQRF
jgi:hypothetical protein